MSDTPQAFDTLNDAVYYAALATRETFADKDEAIALVYEKDGRFFYTQPATEKQLTDRVRARFRIPEGSLRFIVHNHPKGRDNEKFSDNDIAEAERLGVPSAIIFGATTPSIRIFTPGQTETRRMNASRGSRDVRRWSGGDEFAGTMR